MTDSSNLSTSPQETSITTDHVQATISHKPGCHVHIVTHVDATAASAAYAKAFKAVKKEVSIPGFRKGKAPDAVLKREYNTHIEREWRSLLLSTTLREVLDKANIQPLTSQSVKRADVRHCSMEGAECIYDLERYPEVPEIEYTKFHVKKVEPETVTDTDVEQELETVRLSKANWEEIQDRPCQEGDYVELDVDVIENPAHNVFTNRLFCVEKDRMPAWLFALIPGMNVSETKDTTSSEFLCSHTHDTDEHTEACSAKEKQVRVYLKAIKRPILPELNDEFAKQCNHETLEQFRSTVKKMIEDHRKETIQENERLEIYSQLIENYSIDVPKTLVDKETNLRFQHVKRHMNAKKGNLPMDRDREQLLKSQIELEARGFLMCMYLLQKLAQKFQLVITSEEIMHEYSVETFYVPYAQRLIYPGMEPVEIRARLSTKIMIRKGIDHILGNIG